MITLTVLLVVLGILFALVCLGATVLLDPIIAILGIYLLYRLIKLIFKKRK